MMKHGLVGLDVLNTAVHFTAAMLAGSHPDTPFDGECLLTMPYGEQEKVAGDDLRRLKVAVGSLDLLEEPVQRGLMDSAVAVSSGDEHQKRYATLSLGWVMASSTSLS